MPHPSDVQNPDQHEEQLQELFADIAIPVDPLQASSKKISALKKQINIMIDVMADNPSLFAQAARYWGELPLWQKIIGGVVITVPTLILGILTTIGAIISFSICSLIAYAGIGYILDNHYSTSAHTTAGLKDGVGSLADMLSQVVLSLEDIEKDMSAGIEKFTQQNTALEGNVNAFKNQIKEMDLRMEALREHVQAVSVAKATLEQTAVGLKDTVSAQTTFLEENQRLLADARQNLTQAQLELQNRLREFESEKNQLAAEIVDLKAVGDTLSGAVQTLSGTVIEDKTKKQEFLAKMEDMLANKSQGFTTLSAELSKAQKEISALTKQLHDANTRYEQAIKKHELLLQEQGVQLREFRALNESRAASVGGKASGNMYTTYGVKPGLRGAEVNALGYIAGSENTLK